MELFERFCKEYNLEYSFELINIGFGHCQYKDYETLKAYIIFKYSANFKECY